MEYVIVIGIDVQRKFIQVCLMDKAGSEQFNDRLDLRAGVPHQHAVVAVGMPDGELGEKRRPIVHQTPPQEHRADR